MELILSADPVKEKETARLTEECRLLKEHGIIPSMKVILVGENPASILYTNNKKKYIESIGGKCEIIKVKESIGEQEFTELVSQTVDEQSVHGCFVQLPLPSQLANIRVGEMIPPHKDVDGFNPYNLYNLLCGNISQGTLLPCTPKGIITILKHYSIEIAGKRVAILGRSMIVGKPMALMIANENGTPTICHSKSQNTKDICKNSDIIISATGKANFLDSSYIGENRPVVIDVGINKDGQGKLCGDVKFAEVSKLCSAITPVPGGVGPMTIISLTDNLILAAKHA